MKRVFLYNPANDIALATGQRRFTPPRQAELLCRYGAPVMWWLGDGSDYVVVPPQLFEENGDALCGWLQQTEKKFGPGLRWLRIYKGWMWKASNPGGGAMTCSIGYKHYLLHKHYSWAGCIGLIQSEI